MLILPDDYIYMDIVNERRVSITVDIFFFIYYKCEEQKGGVGGGKHVEGGGAEDLGNREGIKLIISLNFLGKKNFSGFANWVKIETTLKLNDFDNAIDKKLLINLSLKGLWYVFSIWFLPWSMRCI